LENQRSYYSYCYNGEIPENENQLVLIKDILSDGTILIPDNDKLFGQLIRLLFIGTNFGNAGNPLFDQQKCLDYHYNKYDGSKLEFLNYTRMMYFSAMEEVKMTRVKEVIDKRIANWLDNSLLELRAAVPSFRPYLIGVPDWKEIAWQYNTGKKYQHKQDLIALFWNAFVYFERKFEAYFERHATIDYAVLNELIYKFRQSFPKNDRKAGVNYFDDLMEQMIEKYENLLPKTSVEISLTLEEKLDKVLDFIVANKTRHNINHACVHQVIFEEKLAGQETRQLFNRIASSGIVRNIKDRYIGWSIDTEPFLASGGFSRRKLIGSSQERKLEAEIFFSYCWKNQEFAERLYKDLKGTGLACRKDNHELEYKSSISHFMESIRDSDYAVLLISDDYLKSQNCMIEFSHLMQDRNHKEKMLPVLMPGTSIFQPQNRVIYTAYWKEEHRKLNEMLREGDLEDFTFEIRLLKELRDIAQNINSYLALLSDMLQLKQFDMNSVPSKVLIEKISAYRKLSD